MTLDRHTQSTEQPFRGKEIQNDTLRDRNLFRRNSHRLVVQAEIDDQLFGRPRDATEICVRCDGVRVVEFQLGPLLWRSPGIALRRALRFFLGHGVPFHFGVTFFVW